MKRLFDAITDKFITFTGLALLAAYSFSVSFYSSFAGLVGLLFVLIYIGFLLFRIYFNIKKDVEDASDKSVHLNLFSYLPKNLYMPILSVNEKNRISGFNKAFDVSSAFGIPVRKAELFDYGTEFLFKEIKNFVDTHSGEPIVKTFGYYVFEIYPYQYNFGKRDQYLLFWNDITELEKTKEKRRLESPAAIYAMVDNAAEVALYADEANRETSAKISELLREWSKSFDGILKEYDRGEYIILCTRNVIDEMEKDNFRIIDSINSSLGTGLNVSLTVSMGIGCGSDSLVEIESLAKSALNSAIEGGGAKAVIKDGEDTRTYGGRVKSGQKSTITRSRVEAKRLISQINSSDKVIIMGHRFSDLDSIASCVGLARLCFHLEKTVYIVKKGDESDWKRVLDSLSHLKEYDEVFLEEDEAQEKLSPDTLVIVVDANRMQLFQSANIVKNCAKLAIIDHHRAQEDIGIECVVKYIDPSVSSASELISEMLDQTLPESSLNDIEAQLLFAGIMLDTASFQRNVGPRTFSAALYLRNESPSIINFDTFLRVPYDYHKKIADYLNTIQPYHDMYAIAYSQQDLGKSASVINAKAAEYMLTIADISVAFALYEMDGAVQISGRSIHPRVSVEMILKHIGGGGHFESAGARLNGMSVYEAIEELKKAIDIEIEALNG